MPVDETITPARSALMARIGSKNTKPEMVVRRLLHALGLRFRLHRADLPGTPDIVMPAAKKAIFVHGCFWHRHAGCPKASIPRTRAGFWKDKFDRNVERDVRKERDLRALGWDVVTVWECQTRDIQTLRRNLEEWLGKRV